MVNDLDDDLEAVEPKLKKARIRWERMGSNKVKENKFKPKSNDCPF